MRPFAPTSLLVPDPDIGSILIWQGSKETVPASWSLCDGTNGTPDLRDRFIVGNSVGLPFKSTGGVDSHDHDFTGDGHFHVYPAGIDMPHGGGISSTTTSNPIVGTTDPKSHLPLWYSLCYIMFVGGD